MGLDISPVTLLDEPHWRYSYGGFHSLRKAVARAIGLDLDAMVGFGGTAEFDPKHPLTPLLSHSDCEGVIDRGDCDAMVPVLAALKVEGVFEQDALNDLVAVMREGAEHRGVMFH